MGERGQAAIVGFSQENATRSDGIFFGGKGDCILDIYGNGNEAEALFDNNDSAG